MLRTHRERKAEYVKSLEAEVADLRAKDAANHTKLTRYAIVNGRLTALLAANNILIPPELQCVDNAAEQTSVEVCGGEAGSQYLQLSHPKSPSSYTSDPGAVDFSNPQIAIDFILALEQPCLKDFYTNPEPTGGGGHSLQLQSPIVDLAPAPKKSQEGTYWPVGSTWSIPTAQLEEQLEKLLQASKQLPLTGELTGVVCWMAIKNNPQNHKITSAKLEKLKELLAAEVDCCGCV